MFAKFKDLIWLKPSDEIVLKSDETERGIRVHDLCSVVCNRWLTDDVLDFLFQSLNVETIPHHFQVLSQPLMLCRSFRQRFLDVLDRRFSNGSLNYIHFALNVKKCPKSGVVTVSSSGNRWTYFSFSVALDEMYYGDSLGWTIPENLFSLLEPMFKLFQSSATQNAASTQPKVMHAPHSLDHKGNHKCCSLCCQAFPVQRCGNICGFNPLLMCSLAASNPLLWKTVVAECPPPLSIRRIVSRLTNLMELSSLLRVEVMSRLVNRRVNFSPMILDLESLPQSHELATGSVNCQGMLYSTYTITITTYHFSRCLPHSKYNLVLNCLPFEKWLSLKFPFCFGCHVTRAAHMCTRNAKYDFYTSLPCIFLLSTTNRPT